MFIFNVSCRIAIISHFGSITVYVNIFDKEEIATFATKSEVYLM